MNRLSRFILLLVLALSACAPQSSPSPSSPGTLTVFAAASLTQVFGDLGPMFEQRVPGVKVRFNFAGSQALRTQIEQGAQADVIATADETTMDELVGAGYVSHDSVRPLAGNKLVVILPGNNPADIYELKDLARLGVKLVIAAQDVPAGKYALQALDKMDAHFGKGFEAQVLGNVVSKEDNVRQVVAKVQLGEADAGIVYVSDAAAAPVLRTLEIPPELNVSAVYVISPLVSASRQDVAAAFVEFTQSPAARPVFERWGFTPLP